MSNQVLITGIGGFCGRHLCAYLARQGCAVFGIDLMDPTLPNATIYTGDLRDADFVRQVIHTVRPRYLFHLAGLTDPQVDLWTLFDVNMRGTECLLEAIRLERLDPIILVTSSSAVYGLVEPDQIPINEAQPFSPVNAYAISKIAQEMLAYSYLARYGLRVIRTRAFNLIGSGQPHSLVCSAFARQIAEIEAGRRAPIISVGLLTPQRDFVDVQDAASAYWLVAQHSQPGQVYNVCSGQATSIQACLDALLKLARVTVRVEVDAGRIRPADIPISVGDNTLLRKQSGWIPTTPLEQSLADVLNDWRRRIQEA